MLDTLLSEIKININEGLFLKDPESSELGNAIITNSVVLLDQLGFEQFTFKKLAQKIKSTESSIYRYFENKHKLLLYLCSLYWGMLEYRVVVATNSIECNEKRLLKALELITGRPENIETLTNVNQISLRNIVVSEFTKAYHNKMVDDENKSGFFQIYKRLVLRIVEMIKSIDPTYQFPNSLASTILDGALHQHYLKEHFKNITDANNSSPSLFFKDLVVNQLKIKNNG
ncbi:MAG: TetR/AcrR family transcriptional regulator [Flavobacteriaceae bacterium]|nr:TetR/AcrR family transcriptional regulator [Flavobacteriaceae bacterium]